MLKVSVNIPEASLKAVRKAVEAKLKERLELIALQTYNYIVMHEQPYYSGSYASSWNIRAGTPDRSFNKPVFKRDVYAPADTEMAINIPNVYSKVYISNYVPHAREVELVGTPSHTFPWMIAASARNATLLRYNFF